MQDVGIHLYLGGQPGGAGPGSGRLARSGIAREDLPAVVEHVIARYRVVAESKERLRQLVERLGPAALLPADAALPRAPAG